MPLCYSFKIIFHFFYSPRMILQSCSSRGKKDWATETRCLLPLVPFSQVVKVMHFQCSIWFVLCSYLTFRTTNFQSRFSEPLKRFYGNKEISEGQNHVCSSPAISEMGHKKCTGILRRVFSQFVGEIIEGMAGFVPLPVIMGKLLSDNGNQEFGDFKFTILKMLGTYGYERRILVCVV